MKFPCVVSEPALIFTCGLLNEGRRSESHNGRGFNDDNIFATWFQTRVRGTSAVALYHLWSGAREVGPIFSYAHIVVENNAIAQIP
jgi:hypothetical protein